MMMDHLDGCLLPVPETETVAVLMGEEEMMEAEMMQGETKTMMDVQDRERRWETRTMEKEPLQELSWARLALQ